MEYHVRTCRCFPFSVSLKRPDGLRRNLVRGLVRDPFARRFTKVKGGVQVHLHTCFPYLRNGWTDCTDIWCVARGPIAMRFTVTSGTQRMCARAHPFFIS